MAAYLFGAGALTPPNNSSLPFLRDILFMKVGFHVNENLESIILRKQREQDQCGMIFWGYGGVACHPTKQVLPFVLEAIFNNGAPYLAMSITKSRFDGRPTYAKEYSIDGNAWMPLPEGVMVKGSKYAIVCRNLRAVQLGINLSNYSVSVGPNRGKSLSNYLRYRVDKACATVLGDFQNGEKESVISYVAEIVNPYAVFLR